MQNIKQLMDQICTPHLVFHYKVLSHWVVIILAILIAIAVTGMIKNLLNNIDQKQPAATLEIVSGIVAIIAALVILIIFISPFWNAKTKIWYDATVNSSSVFNREKQEVAKEYPFCVVIEEHDDIDKPLYFVFCKNETAVNHIDNQINRLENNGSAMFLNSNSNTAIIHVTNFKKVKTKYSAPWPENRQYYAYLPQSYFIVDQSSVLDDPAIESNIVNTNQLNSNLIKLFNGSN